MQLNGTVALSEGDVPIGRELYEQKTLENHCRYFDAGHDFYSVSNRRKRYYAPYGIWHFNDYVVYCPQHFESVMVDVDWKRQIQYASYGHDNIKLPAAFEYAYRHFQWNFVCRNTASV